MRRYSFSGTLSRRANLSWSHQFIHHLDENEDGFTGLQPAVLGVRVAGKQKCPFGHLAAARPSSTTWRPVALWMAGLTGD
jgi:hypothetical protein